jgi:O-antigen/teichoic acid export membrane protein
MSQSKKQLFLYSFFMTGAAILGILKLTVYAKLLNVEDFGLYSLMMSGYLFIMYAGSFGLNEALVKKGSIAYGLGDFRLIKDMRDMALFCSTLGVFFFSFVALVFVQIFVDDDSMRSVLSLMGLLAIATLEFNLVSSYFRVNHKFVVFSQMLFIKSLLVVTLVWYVAPSFGVHGVVVLEVLVFLLLAFGVLFVDKARIDIGRVLLNGRLLFKNSIKQGLPVMVSTVIRNLTLNIDRWVIVATLGIVALAKYAFAMILYQATMVGIGFIGTVLGTKWLSEFGEDSDLGGMFAKIKKIMLTGSIVLITLAWPFLYLLLYVIDLYYPDYAAIDLTLTVIFIYFGSIFLMLTYALDWLFIASSNELILLRLSVYSLILTVFLIFFTYMAEAEIYIYAFIFLFVRLVNLSLSLFSVSRFLKLKVFSF